MLAVSSRTKTATGRRTRIGMLTLDGARPLPHAQEERRGTPGRGAEISQPCGISAALNASVMVWLA
jgi:hypothetical protein